MGEAFVGLPYLYEIRFSYHNACVICIPCVRRARACVRRASACVTALNFMTAQCECWWNDLPTSKWTCDWGVSQWFWMSRCSKCHGWASQSWSQWIWHSVNELVSLPVSEWLWVGLLLELKFDCENWLPSLLWLMVFSRNYFSGAFILVL